MKTDKTPERLVDEFYAEVGRLVVVSFVSGAVAGCLGTLIAHVLLG